MPLPQRGDLSFLLLCTFVYPLLYPQRGYGYARVLLSPLLPVYFLRYVLCIKDAHPLFTLSLPLCLPFQGTYVRTMALPLCTYFLTFGCASSYPFFTPLGYWVRKQRRSPPTLPPKGVQVNKGVQVRRRRRRVRVQPKVTGEPYLRFKVSRLLYPFGV